MTCYKLHPVYNKCLQIRPYILHPGDLRKIKTYFCIKELSVEGRDERFPFPIQERFSVLLFSPVSWEVSHLNVFERLSCHFTNMSYFDFACDISLLNY